MAFHGQKHGWVGEQMGQMFSDVLFTTLVFCSLQQPVLAPVMSITVWVTQLERNPFFPFWRRCRMNRNKAISWFLLKCSSASCGVENGIRCTSVADSTWALPLQILFISPYFMSWYWHTSFHFPGCFLVLLQDCTTRHGEFPEPGAAVLSWARSQLAWAVCPALKATCVTTASHLAPDSCKLPSLFYYFIPFIDDQAWRIFFFNYSGLEGAFFPF